MKDEKNPEPFRLRIIIQTGLHRPQKIDSAVQKAVLFGDQIFAYWDW